MNARKSRRSEPVETYYIIEDSIYDYISTVNISVVAVAF